MTGRALYGQQPETDDPDPTLQTVLEQVGRVHWMNGRELPELHIHPQTVRYRLRQLRELFGETRDDHDLRARLFLALIWPT